MSCHTVAKRTASLFRKRGVSAKGRLDLCLQLLDNRTEDKRLQPLLTAMRHLPIDDQHYWVGIFYTLLLPREKRRSLSAFFTPPKIARHLLDAIERQGIDWTKARVLDPAAGGAAFLSMVAARMLAKGCASQDILKRIKGIEIDPSLAQLSRILIARRLVLTSIPEKTVVVGNALKCRLRPSFYDLVLANPPYGRVFPKDVRSLKWQQTCHPGHINLYALFVDLALRAVRPNAQIGLVVPSSFIAGPLYSRLRTEIRSRSRVDVLGHVECRESFFLDVLQDVSLLKLTKSVNGHPIARPVAFGRISDLGEWDDVSAINLPASAGDGWTLPYSETLPRGGAVLADYGCSVSSGYFVWNREKRRMATKPKKQGKWVPLYWACNVRPLVSCKPKSRRGKGRDYVRFDDKNTAIIRGKSILLQRTTNNNQPRRLIAGLVDKGKHLKSGYTSENHTIVVRPTSPAANLELVCKLLNSAAVDQRYRQVSGTASVSTLLLRNLDLPSVESLQDALTQPLDFDSAVERAYKTSEQSSWAIAS